MRHFQKSKFSEATLEELHGLIASLKERDFTFVQICASTVEGGCDLLYALRDPERTEPGMDGWIVNVPQGEHVPSITDLYPAAFVFENETHDLFGIDFDDISIDYHGHFYTVPVAYPMNPQTEEDKAAVEAAEQRGGNK